MPPINTAPTFSSGDGAVTTAIGSGLDFAYGVALQSDGRIVVAGHSDLGANDSFSLVRYNADGSLDTSTAVGPASSIAQSVTLQPDGRILAAGHASDGSGSDFALVRYNPDGSLDTSFDGDGVVLTPIGSLGDIGNSVALQSDGRIVVAGYLAVGPDQDFALARYNPDGSLDTSFGGDGTVTTAVGPGFEFGHSVVVQPDGRIVVAGNSSNGTNDDLTVLRYNADGSLDPSFSGDGMPPSRSDRSTTAAALRSSPTAGSWWRAGA